jgi:hypothetical protein
MRRRVWSEVLVLALLVLTAGACDDDSGTPIDPTPPPVSTTETFSNVLTVNGAWTGQFTSNAGSVTATMTALTPDPLAVIGMAIGTWSGTTCQIILANDNASMNAVVNGAVTMQGTLCVRIYDVGKISGPVTFSVAVEHF